MFLIEEMLAVLVGCDHFTGDKVSYCMASGGVPLYAAFLYIEPYSWKSMGKKTAKCKVRPIRNIYATTKGRTNGRTKSSVGSRSAPTISFH